MAVTVVLLDGREFSLASETPAALKRKLCAAATLGVEPGELRLAHDGALLADHDRDVLASLPPDARLVCWSPRYTRRRSDEALELASARRRRAAAADPDGALRRLGRHAALARDAALRIPLRWWAVAAAWAGVGAAAVRAEMLPLFLFVSGLVAIFGFGLGERRLGEESAYTVFNDGYRALPGQLRAEDLERDLLRGI